MTARELRARAEDALRLTRRDVAKLRKGDVKTLVYELQVHQVELEMQNEALRVTQETLEASHAKYQRLFDYAPVGYLIADANGRVLHANMAAQALLQPASVSIAGQLLSRFVHRSDQETFERELAKVGRHTLVTCELRLTTPQPQPKTVRLDLAVLPGATTERLIVLTEVTERKRLVEALSLATRELEARVAERTAELAERNRQLETEIAERTKSEAARRELEARLREAQRFESLGLLAGGIAHDFNNLLVGVMGNAELLERTETTQHELLSLIKRACNQALGLTRQLLMFAGKGVLNMAPVKLPKVVAENLEHLRSSLPPGIRLQTQLAPQVGDILGDRSQINQVVMNLVVNAIEALDGQGALLVRTAEQQLDAKALADFHYCKSAQPGRYVVLSVRDRGPGIEPQTLPRIFDPFFSTKFTGRGLGLATVLGVVQSHHGALRVSSELGVGTCVEVALPVAGRRRESERPRVVDDPQWRGSGRVLLIDDDDAVRAVMAKLLQLLGFDVLDVNDGNVALECFGRAEPPFELVVCDWIMPGFSGAQLIDALRALRATQPIILISGYNPEDLGTYDQHVVCLQKPMTLQQLRDAARGLLGARRPATQRQRGLVS